MKTVRTIFIVYVAVVSLIGLIMTTTASAQLLNAGLKTWIFTSADVPSYLEDCNDPDAREVYIYTEGPSDETLTDTEKISQCEDRKERTLENYGQEKARDAVRNLALLIVSIPLFLVHFRLFLNERRGLDKKDGKKSDSKK
ncbi:MAG TPA: hypothetical protein QF873_01140 [Patescibacteria group bacterium]|nr:hypothetical protein [Patescibacteria group bacterium]